MMVTALKDLGDKVVLTKQEKEAMIRDAAQVCYEAGVEADMLPVSTHLLSVGHTYGGDFCFVLCVAAAVGDLQAVAEGFESQTDRAVKRMRAKMKGGAHV